MKTCDRLTEELMKMYKIEMDREDYYKAAHYKALAYRARTGEFDDYGDAHACVPTQLYCYLTNVGLHKFAQRVANGEFDATKEESEEWARSQTDPETVKIMEAMGIGPNRSKDA